MSESLPTLHLPESIVTKADVLRLKKELKNMEKAFHEQQLRQQESRITASESLRSMAELNKRTITNREDCLSLLGMVETLVAEAPVVHISFASPPSPAFLGRIIAWFRVEVRPDVLLRLIT